MAKRVLVVDDERTTTVLLKNRLEQTGRYEVRAENSGRGALVAAREFRPDLVILDVMMPEMGGNEVADEMRNDPRLADIPVIFLTSIVTKEDAGPDGGIIGGNRFIAKPVDPQKIIDYVDDLLG